MMKMVGRKGGRGNKKKDRGLTLAVMAEHFSTEEKAIALVEKMRWPKGPVCVHCGAVTVYRLKGAKCRPGLLKCAVCRRQFTVKVGTIFEDSHIPLRHWLLTIHLMCASKKGVSSHQISRALGVQYKTAWFMTHRIRHVLHDPVFKGMFDGVVEADETYIGPKKVHGKRGRGAGRKQIVFGLVERGGRVRPVHVQRITGKTLKGIIRDNVKRAAVISTDEFVSYNGLAKEFKGHLRVNHGKKEYVNGEAHVNTAESFWALLKRGVHGIFHHISAKHLHRYLDEFAYRFDTRKGSDGDRILKLLQQIGGKRLLYKVPVGL